jgi:hypothetical protein
MLRVLNVKCATGYPYEIIWTPAYGWKMCAGEAGKKGRDDGHFLFPLLGPPKKNG